MTTSTLPSFNSTDEGYAPARRDQASVANDSPSGLGSIGEKGANDTPISHLGHVRIAVVGRAIEKNLGRAPGAAFVFGADAADATAFRTVVAWQRDVSITGLKHAKQIGIAQAVPDASPRESDLVGVGGRRRRGLRRGDPGRVENVRG